MKFSTFYGNIQKKKRWTAQSAIKLKSRYDVNCAAVIGAGSIGSRHIRNLRSLGITNVIALRSGQGEAKKIAPDLEVKEVENWDQLFACRPDIVVISNPTSLHPEAVKACLPYVRGVFIEKPLAGTLEEVPELLKLIKSANVVSFVGYNLQFHPAIKVIQEFLQSERAGKPLVFQCQVGHWIGDWHPNEDYSKSYVARKDLGGGVSRTLVHEVHLAVELLGPARSVFGLLPSSDLLSLEVDSVSDMMVAHSSGAVSQIHLDLIQRPAHRTGVISCLRFGRKGSEFSDRRPNGASGCVA